MQRARNLRWRVGLWEKDAALWKQLLNVLKFQPRSDDDLNRGPTVAHRMSEFDPVHRARHVDIGEHHPDIVSILQDTYRLISIFCPDSFKSSVRDQVQGVHKHEGFVFDDKHNEAFLLFHSRASAYRVLRLIPEPTSTL